MSDTYAKKINGNLIAASEVVPSSPLSTALDNKADLANTSQALLSEPSQAATKYLIVSQTTFIGSATSAWINYDLSMIIQSRHSGTGLAVIQCNINTSSPTETSLSGTINIFTTTTPHRISSPLMMYRKYDASTYKWTITVVVSCTDYNNFKIKSVLSKNGLNYSTSCSYVTDLTTLGTLIATAVTASNSNHTHGNIANGGTLTDTAAAAAGNDYVVIRDADNSKIQTSTIKGTDVADAVSKKHSHSTITLSTTAQAYDGSHTLALPSTDPYTSARTPTSHASSTTTYGVGTTANYGHVKLDNSTPLTVGTANADGVATGKAHVHNALESVARASVTSANIDHSYTHDRAHMVLSQMSSQTTTGKPASDGYVLTFMWDNGGAYDSQIFIPNGGETPSFGRLQFRSRGIAGSYGNWGDWKYLPAAATGTLLTSSDNLNNFKGDGFGNIIGYLWESTSTPSNTPFTDNHGAMMVVYGTSKTTYCIQVVYRASKGIYQRRLENGTWGAWEKMLVSSDITTGSANGTISVAGSDVAVKGLGGAAYLNTGTASGTVATGNHTHTTSIASDSSSGTVVTLAHDTQYKLTAGGTSVLFKTPADSNTDTKVTQTLTTTADAAYPILTKNTTETSNVTDTSRFTTGVTLNPKNKSITATTFIGALSGNAATATKINTSTKIGDTNKPVYIAADGTVTPISYTIATSVPSGAVFTDTKVTSSGNHYTPATSSGSEKTASASGATAAWSIDVVKGITISTDGKGHITDLAVTSGKIPSNPNTDTKQRIVASDSKTYYLTGVTTAPTSSNQDLTGVANANVYATAGQLHATTFDVNSKCTLQFNTTTNALDFVFA